MNLRRRFAASTQNCASDFSATLISTSAGYAERVLGQTSQQLLPVASGGAVVETRAKAVEVVGGLKRHDKRSSSTGKRYVTAPIMGIGVRGYRGLTPDI